MKIDLMKETASPNSRLCELCPSCKQAEEQFPRLFAQSSEKRLTRRSKFSTVSPTSTNLCNIFVTNITQNRTRTPGLSGRHRLQPRCCTLQQEIQRPDDSLRKGIYVRSSFKGGISIRISAFSAVYLSIRFTCNNKRPTPRHLSYKRNVDSVVQCYLHKRLRAAFQ